MARSTDEQLAKVAARIIAGKRGGVDLLDKLADLSEHEIATLNLMLSEETGVFANVHAIVLAVEAHEAEGESYGP